MTNSNQTEGSITWRLPRVGELIGGQYRVERLLGVGGMGAVVEATHLERNQRFAVKLMLPGRKEQGVNTARFLREGQAAASLRSEHALRVLDIHAADDELFLIMDLLDGESLEAFVYRQGPLSIEDAVGYLLQACDAIAEAHALGIVHRDLKPGNLFLCRLPDGRRAIKVLDFGISKIVHLPAANQLALTDTGATLGSPRFASPEQLRDAKRTDARTDIWSLGVTLYWLLTRRFPFEASSLCEHFMKLVTETPTPLRAQRPDIPAELEAIVLRCLEKSIDRRFQNVGELALALEPLAPEWARHLVRRVAARLGMRTRWRISQWARALGWPAPARRRPQAASTSPDKRRARTSSVMKRRGLSLPWERMVSSMGLAALVVGCAASSHGASNSSAATLGAPAERQPALYALRAHAESRAPQAVDGMTRGDMR